jgi:translation elongation factor EF-G
MVIDAAVEFLPSPAEVNDGNLTVMDEDTKEELKTFAIGSDTSLAAIAFKVATDPFV